MREFKIKNIKYRIVNRYTGNCEINEYNKKYNLLSFNQRLNGWTSGDDYLYVAGSLQGAKRWVGKNFIKVL